jgi:hypothetical protein
MTRNQFLYVRLLQLNVGALIRYSCVLWGDIKKIMKVDYGWEFGRLFVGCYEELEEHFSAEAIDHPYDDVYQVAEKTVIVLLFLFIVYYGNFLSHRINIRPTSYLHVISLKKKFLQDPLVGVNCRSLPHVSQKNWQTHETRDHNSRESFLALDRQCVVSLDPRSLRSLCWSLLKSSLCPFRSPICSVMT